MKRLALGVRPHSERVAERLVKVLGGKVLLRRKLCGEPGGLYIILLLFCKVQLNLCI